MITYSFTFPQTKSDLTRAQSKSYHFLSQVYYILLFPLSIDQFGLRHLLSAKIEDRRKKRDAASFKYYPTGTGL